MFQADSGSGPDLCELLENSQSPDDTSAVLSVWAMPCDWLFKTPLALNLSNPPSQTILFRFWSPLQAAILSQALFEDSRWALSQVHCAKKSLLSRYWWDCSTPKAWPFDPQLQADFQPPFGRKREPALGVVPGSHCHFAWRERQHPSLYQHNSHSLKTTVWFPTSASWWELLPGAQPHHLGILLRGLAPILEHGRSLLLLSWASAEIETKNFYFNIPSGLHERGS